ncbi:GH20530 [Drosophila grimshawi]|uniref:GH20530 n=2 Tax=Drosophila grimshawi TaxID=7222 RepID=B4J8P0_DROGR|nr:GH20530 [Drosophila grimshawi]
MPMYCTVLRDGRNQIIKAENVVLGDILQITYGERIAADVRFFESHDLEVNNVALTGHSVSVLIDPEFTHQNKWAGRNVGFACSHVTKGHGRGIVIACGDKSEVGVMASLNMETRSRSRSRKHIQQITYYTHIICILMFFILVCTISLEGLTLQMLIEFNVSLTITLSPIYLPILMYFGLWRTRATLLEKGCYVRNMEAASTLGLTTVLFSSLIGTMTMRSWRVSDIFVNGALESVQHRHQFSENEPFWQLIRASVLCNRAIFSPGQKGVPRMEQTLDGSDYDRALFLFGMRVFTDILDFRSQYETVASKAYDPLTHLQLSVHRTLNDEYLLIIRGFWSVVLSYSSTCFINNNEVELDAIERRIVSNVGLKLKLAGRHTYAFGSKILQPDEQMMALISEDFDCNNKRKYEQFMSAYCNSLCFLGLIATYDPPSHNVRQGVDRCRSAGIKLVLITRADLSFSRAIARAVGVIGQNSETVEDVAMRLGIPESQVNCSMITAAAIDMKNWHKKLHHQRWYARQLLLAHADLVFAAIGVQQRYMLVDLCQQMGAIVTAIGTSVHDSSAIRRANVGVSARAASQTSQSCADITLLDSNFVTLVDAIEESRLLFENMKKALVYTLSPSMASLLIHLSFILLMIPFRLFLIVSLILNFLVGLLPALSLFYEPPEENLMEHKPKIYEDFLFNRRIIIVAFIHVGLIEACAVFTSYFVYMAHNGFLPRTLIGLSVEWYDYSVNDLVDSYGQEWTSGARRLLEIKTLTVVVITFIIMQCINLILAKTGRANLFTHGFGNMRLNIAVIYMICFGFFLTVLDYPTYLRISPVDYYPVFCYILAIGITEYIFRISSSLCVEEFPWQLV